jgi:endogenous inhibitor of DNA gyrase (YacG/DUF329 family)
MGSVMITCPTTGQEVDTGIAMDHRSFVSDLLTYNTLGSCPRCGQNHTWSKEDAWIDEAR